MIRPKPLNHPVLETKVNWTQAHKLLTIGAQCASRPHKAIPSKLSTCITTSVCAGNASWPFACNNESHFRRQRRLPVFVEKLSHFPRRDQQMQRAFDVCLLPFLGNFLHLKKKKKKKWASTLWCTPVMPSPGNHPCTLRTLNLQSRQRVQNWACSFSRNSPPLTKKWELDRRNRQRMQGQLPPCLFFFGHFLLRRFQKLQTSWTALLCTYVETVISFHTKTGAREPEKIKAQIKTTTGSRNDGTQPGWHA